MRHVVKNVHFDASQQFLKAVLKTQTTKQVAIVKE